MPNIHYNTQPQFRRAGNEQKHIHNSKNGQQGNIQSQKHCIGIQAWQKLQDLETI